jgi:histidinol-phosphate/aromatic aminotransferase/cobyric acid decarboxylase-like protein
MKEAGILVTRPFGLGDESGYDTWVRVSFGTEAQMQSFLGEMEKILGKT